MKITFLGATETVTGSKYLLESGGQRILVDCGLFQGQKELRLRNWAPLPVDPTSIDAIVLTHAHLDHSGALPLYVKNGFKGPIYCSEATFDLCKIMLIDSARIQEEDAERANRYSYSKHKPALPLYDMGDVDTCLRLFRVAPFGRPQVIAGGPMEYTLSRAGHILGAAFIKITDGERSILFSGDIGRLNDPVMKSPAQIQNADYLVVESTYGDRLHDGSDPADSLEKIIRKTVARGGTVVIPSFAVGRAQALLYYIYKLKSEGRIHASLTIYLDSPMAEDVTDLLQKHMNDHRLNKDLCRAVCDIATYVRSRDASKALDEVGHHVPSVIVSASGMATGGRVLHHLKRYLGESRNTIILAGFQAAGTRGDRLARGESEIKIHGQMWPVQAEIVKLDNMSAHADSAEILQWLGHFTKPPIKVFVTHGEISAANAMKEKIHAAYGWDAVVPAYLQCEDL